MPRDLVRLYTTCRTNNLSNERTDKRTKFAGPMERYTSILSLTSPMLHTEAPDPPTRVDRQTLAYTKPHQVCRRKV